MNQLLAMSMKKKKEIRLQSVKENICCSKMIKECHTGDPKAFFQSQGFPIQLYRLEMAPLLNKYY